MNLLNKLNKIRKPIVIVLLVLILFYTLKTSGCINDIIENNIDDSVLESNKKIARCSQPDPNDPEKMCLNDTDCDGELNKCDNYSSTFGIIVYSVIGCFFIINLFNLFKVKKNKTSNRDAV